jgi:crotonobetainyl-CoA:carnitine CoA-transferase CaiB-like acyl-CoA transferase
VASDLKGLLVISLEQAVAAPFCSSRLADAGARVIKIERGEGDFARRYDRHVKGQSTYFVWLNRGKQSVCLDLKAEADRALLRRMIAKADVVIQNLAPGALVRLGLDSHTLTRADPRLICCDISGYGDEGPYRDMKAYDLLVQAESGLASLTGGPEGPARVGLSVCDIAAGMYAHAAVLQALVGRERTGRGRIIKVSLFSGMADWMNAPYLQRRYGGSLQDRPGLRHPTISPYGVFPCADGDVLLSVQNEREWVSFCGEVLGEPALATDPRFADITNRVANRVELERLIAERFRQRPKAKVAAVLKAAGIAFGMLNTVDGLIAHPQLRTITCATPEGEVTVIAPAAAIVGDDPSFGAVPAIGAHTADVRTEFA